MTYIDQSKLSSELNEIIASVNKDRLAKIDMHYHAWIIEEIEHVINDLPEAQKLFDEKIAILKTEDISDLKNFMENSFDEASECIEELQCKRITLQRIYENVDDSANEAASLRDEENSDNVYAKIVSSLNSASDAIGEATAKVDLQIEVINYVLFDKIMPFYEICNLVNSERVVEKIKELCTAI